MSPAAAPGSKAYALKFISGKYQGGEFPLKMDRQVIIGRSNDLDMVLVEDMVSRKHAKITYRQGAFWLSDLGSMGGTWIDGTKLAAPRRVAPGQTIDIGVCRLTVVSAGAVGKSAAAKGPSHAA